MYTPPKFVINGLVLGIMITIVLIIFLITNDEAKGLVISSFVVISFLVGVAYPELMKKPEVEKKKKKNDEV